MSFAMMIVLKQFDSLLGSFLSIQACNFCWEFKWRKYSLGWLLAWRKIKPVFFTGAKLAYDTWSWPTQDLGLALMKFWRKLCFDFPHCNIRRFPMLPNCISAEAYMCAYDMCSHVKHSLYSTCLCNQIREFKCLYYCSSENRRWWFGTNSYYMKHSISPTYYILRSESP